MVIGLWERGFVLLVEDGRDFCLEVIPLVRAWLLPRERVFEHNMFLRRWMGG